jgi:hypothetical protein
VLLLLGLLLLLRAGVWLTAAAGFGALLLLKLFATGADPGR